MRLLGTTIHLLLLSGLLALIGPVARAGMGDVAAKRPIVAASCQTCEWGALAQIVAAALRPAGYQLQICTTCNELDSPRYVAYARVPRNRTAEDIELGDPPPPHGRVDFGVTEPHLLEWLYEGKYLYSSDGPQRQLRLLALIEDPVYLLVAVRANSGITDLAQVRSRIRAPRILTEGDIWVAPILKRYHLTRSEVQRAGGRFLDAMALHKDADFDVLISSLGSLANNVESDVWYQMSQRYRLRYLQLPDELLSQITDSLGGEKVELPLGYLRGVDRPIATVGRSGVAICARADLPDEVAYQIAWALDEHQALLKWAIRPFSYDPHTVWKAGPVPLHPGAARYYREVGYLR